MREAEGMLLLFVKKKIKIIVFLVFKKMMIQKISELPVWLVNFKMLHTMLSRNSDDLKHDWKIEKLNRK